MSDAAQVKEWLKDKSGTWEELIASYAAEQTAALRARFTAPIVVMCGSVRFRSTWSVEMARLTDEGYIVLTVGRMLPKAEGEFDPAHKARLDMLHKQKIDLADWVWVLDVGGYIGASTRSEIAYAEQIGRPVRYLSQEYPDFVEPPDPVAEQTTELQAKIAVMRPFVEAKAKRLCICDKRGNCESCRAKIILAAPEAQP